MFNSTHELAWAAGFFDGEGHAASQNRTRNIKIGGRQSFTNIILDIRQVNPYVLHRFQDAVGGIGHIYGPFPRKDNPNGRPVYFYSVTKSEHCQAVIAMLWKWLSPVKRAQVKAAWITWLTRPRLKRGRKPSKPVSEEKA